MGALPGARLGGAVIVAAVSVGCGRVGFGSGDGATGGDGGTAAMWTRFLEASTDAMVKRVTLGADGATIVTGDFRGDLDFAGTPHPAIGLEDLFVGAFTTNGELAWSRTYGGTVYTDGRDVGIDANGSVHVHGLFIGQATFGTTTLDAGSGQDPIVLVHDRMGNITDARAFTSTGANAQGRGIGVTAGGDVLVSGSYEGTVTIGTTMLADAPGMASYVARVDAQGPIPWVLAFTGTTRVAANDVDVNPSGDAVCAAGDFTGASSFAGMPLSPFGMADAFLARITMAGAVAWVLRIGGAAFDRADAVITTADGDCVVVGSVTGEADFGAGPLAGRGGADGFVARYGPAGDLRWAHVLGGAGDDVALAVDEGADGTIAVSGWFSGSGTFAGHDLTSAGGLDAYVVAFDPSGTALWARRSGGAGDETPYAVTIDTDRRAVAIAGDFTGATVLGTDMRTGTLIGFVHRQPY